MAKSPDAFRTISEVADWLDTPAHVLRFWESRFPQIKPVKRAGGRRYYRPGDMLLIGGIKKLLHEDGMTIKGARKILREKGVKYVAGLSRPLDTPLRDLPGISDVTIEARPVPQPAPGASPRIEPQPEAAADPEASPRGAEPSETKPDPAPAPENMDALESTPDSPAAPDTREISPEVTRESGHAPAETVPPEAPLPGTTAEPAEAAQPLPEPQPRESEGLMAADAPPAEAPVSPETPPRAAPESPAPEAEPPPSAETPAPGETARPAEPDEAAEPGERARGDAEENAPRPLATSPLPEPDFATVLALLRNRPAGAPPPEQARITAIRERLVALHARMGDPGRESPPG